MSSKNACVVENCCFCGDLRTGSFIIGYLNLAWSLLASAIYALAVSAAVTLGFGYTDILAILSVFLSISVIRVIFVIVFVVGLHQYKPRHVMAYLVFSCIFVVLAIALFIAQLVVGTNALDIVFTVLDILLNIYFLVVIRSYYFVMQQPASPPMMFQPTVVNMQQPQYVAQQPPQFGGEQQPQYVGQHQPGVPQHFAK